MNATPIYSDDGEIVSAVAVLQDMTPLEEMERLRNEFLAVVSHELRGPLTAIKGSTATVLSASTPFPPAETTRFFQTIDRQADLLSDLVSNLLDVTKIEAGALLFTPKPTDMAALINEVAGAFDRNGARNHVKVDLPPDLPPVSADSQRVTQVLNNLLSNASKYSPASSKIEIAASLNESHVAVSVIDEGRGVPPDQMRNLFKKFSRIGAWDGEENVEGHGLGLSICKGIVEAHGGRIWAESDGEGRGARFTFTIPMASDAEDDPAQTSTPAGKMTATGDRIRVLCVDDDPQILRHIRNTLSDAGYRPIVTSNPMEMMHFFETERPHLVLLDMVLPGTDGFALMKRIREISDVPIIFLSGSGESEDTVRAFEMGASDYITKPFSPPELIARIDAALRAQARPDAREERKPYQLYDITIDYSDRVVTLGDREVQLTATEYKLLFQLSISAGRVLTHEQLLHRVWGADYSDEGQLVRVFVGKLRNKLGDDATNPKFIFTEPRVGYRMAAPYTNLA